MTKSINLIARFIAATAIALVLITAPLFAFMPMSTWAQTAATIYMSSNSDDINTFTPPGPGSNYAHLPFGTNPEGLAFDTSGNLFVAGGADVSKITPGGAVSHFADLPPGAGGYGMAIDAGNNLYVADLSDSEVSKITPSGAVSHYGTVSSPRGLTFDDSGNLYVVSGYGTIEVIAPGGGTSSTYATLTGHPNIYGLAFDSAGYLYVSDITSTALLKIAPGGGSFSDFGTTLSSGPKGLTFGPTGILFAAQPNEDKISQIAPDGTASTYGTGLNGPRYLAFNSGPAKAARVAGFATAIPGGTGNFTSLPGAPGFSGIGAVAFYGEGVGGQAGVYRSISGPPIKVADLNTAIPSGTGNFTAFLLQGPPIVPAIEGSNVAFFGAGSGGQQGIYVGIPGNPIRIADAATAIPGGSGNFTAFTQTGVAPSPVLSGNNVAFFGAGSGGQQGIYAGDFSIIGPPITIADTATLIPGGTGVFTAFPQQPSLSGANVAFLGTGSSGQQGVYRAQVGPPIKVADLNTAIPNGTGNFTSFLAQGPPIVPAIEGSNVAFFGAGSGGQQGIYVGIPGNPIRIADAATAIPGGTGNFTSFGDVSLSATDVAFLGYGASGQGGIYDMSGGSLSNVIHVGDILDGRAITGLSLSHTGLSGDPIAFRATFADGSQGIYVANIVPPPTPTQVVSRKLHSGAPFDITLPLTGASGIECRSGGASNDYQVIFTFPNTVTFTNASVTAGTGSVSGTGGNGTATVIIDVTGVTNAQRITVTLLGVSDGVSTADLGVQMGVLIGDTNGNGTVSASDIGQTKSKSGQTTDASNFRTDVNASGIISAADIALVKSKSGTTLPP